MNNKNRREGKAVDAENLNPPVAIVRRGYDDHEYEDDSYRLTDATS